jgi:hypothetical protein
MAKCGPAPNYKPDNCTIAYKFCLLGATNEDLAGLFKVSARGRLGSVTFPVARHPACPSPVLRSGSSLLFAGDYRWM